MSATIAMQRLVTIDLPGVRQSSSATIAATADELEVAKVEATHTATPVPETALSFLSFLKSPTSTI